MRSCVIALALMEQVCTSQKADRTDQPFGICIFPRVSALSRRGLATRRCLASPVRHERTNQGRPPGLMRCTKALTRVAVEVFIEKEGIAPRRVTLKALVRSVHRTPAVCVEQKQLEQSALKLVGYLIQVRLHARTGRQFHRDAYAKASAQIPKRLDRKKVERQPDRPAPV